VKLYLHFIKVSIIAFQLETTKESQCRHPGWEFRIRRENDPGIIDANQDQFPIGLHANVVAEQEGK